MFYHYPAIVRLWHFLNAIFILGLIITGLIMQYSDPGKPIMFSGLPVRLHNICGIALSLNYLIFIGGNVLTGNGKNYRIPVSGLFSRISAQLRYYLRGYFRKEESPFPVTDERKFNPLQALTYATTMYTGFPVLLITGWGLLLPGAIAEKIFGISGLLLTNLLHIITGFLMTVFMIIHIYICTIGTNPGNNFRSIITGWKEVEKKSRITDSE